MGVRIIDINFILKNLKKKKYKKILILGYQNIYFNKEYLNLLKNKYDYDKCENLFDINKNIGQVDCLEVFKLLSNNIDIMDISDYEGANIIYDLSSSPEDMPKHLTDKYDLVLDWGTSEHVFNIINCYKNINNMLSSDGEYMCLTPMNAMPDHGYYQISPNFYLDFFNKIFSNLSVNILQIEQLYTPIEKWSLYPYYKNCIDHLVNGGIDNKIYFNFVHAMKSADSYLSDDIYQYQFVEHWNGNRKGNVLLERQEKKMKKYFFGFEYINNVEKIDSNVDHPILNIEPQFVLNFIECI
jgi:hypothetical protein